MDATNIAELFKELPSIGKFRPYAEHTPASDAVNFYFKGDPDYSERLTEHVTLFRSIESGSLVGCRIKGVAGILENLPNSISIDHDNIKVSLLVWSFVGSADENERRTLKELAEAAADLKLEPACA